MLLRDILEGDDPQILATLEVIVRADADILLLLDMDFDAGATALNALAAALAEAGAPYPHLFTRRPNTGWPTGTDVDGDGRRYEPRDSHGYGAFNGQGGMALLSRYPIGSVRAFRDVLWRDLPGARAAEVLSPDALSVLRLASLDAWDVAIDLPDGTAFHVLASHATPPVFDGPEDRNGVRNADETRFWQLYLDGWSPDGPPFSAEAFAVMATLNVDPERGEGLRPVLQDLLDHPALQDPVPRGGGGTATADWDEPSPGNLRVDYILPASGLTVLDSGVMWDEGDEAAAAASDHRLVWVDLAF